MFHLIGILASIAIAGFGYWQARKFVQSKLRSLRQTPYIPADRASDCRLVEPLS